MDKKRSRKRRRHTGRKVAGGAVLIALLLAGGHFGLGIGREDGGLLTSGRLQDAVETVSQTVQSAQQTVSQTVQGAQETVPETAQPVQQIVVPQDDGVLSIVVREDKLLYEGQEVTLAQLEEDLLRDYKAETRPAAEAEHPVHHGEIGESLKASAAFSFLVIPTEGAQTQKVCSYRGMSDRVEGPLNENAWGWNKHSTAQRSFDLAYGLAQDDKGKLKQKASQRGLCSVHSPLFLLAFLFFRRFFSLPKGAELSAACGRFSEAQHGQNTEKSNGVQISTMFCPWGEKAAK